MARSSSVDDQMAQMQLQPSPAGVDFDQLVENLGGFGHYQILVFLLGCLASFMTGLGAVSTVFTAYNNPRRCFVPGCDSEDSSYDEEFLNFTIHYDTKSNMYDNCYMYYNTYDGNETAICYEKYFDESRTLNCTEWVYDTEIFTSTLITTFDLVCDRAFLAPLSGSTFIAGMMFGSIVVGVVADKYGRKIGIVVSVLLYGVFSLGCAIAPNYILFLVFRALAGAGVTALFQVAFVIAIELLNSKWRGFCGMMIEIPFPLGELATGVFAYFIRDWKLLQVAIAAPVLLLLSYYWIMPESIRWMVSKNRIDDACKVIDRAAKINKIQSPRHLLKDGAENENLWTKAEVKKKNSQRKSVLMLLKSPNMRKRTLILFYCWSVCTLDYYGLSTNSGNLPGNIFVSYSLNMLIEIPSYFITYYSLDKIGRKWTLALLYLIGGIACLISAILPTDMGWLIISLSLLGKFGIAGAFASIYVYTAELYPTECRNVGIGACSMISRFAGVFAPIVAGLSIYYQPIPLFIFGAFSFLAGCLIILLPETLGAELPQTVEESEAFGKDQAGIHFSCCSRREGRKDDNNYDQAGAVY